MSLNLLQYFALRNLTHSRARSILTLLGVTLGIALQTGIQAINQSTLDSFHESVEATVGRATLSVMAGEAGFNEKTEELIRGVPGVKSSAPMIEANVYFKSSTGKAEPIVLFGIDLLKEQSVRSYKTDDSVIEDPLEFLNQPDSLILTKEFAERYHFKVGDSIELSTALGQKRFIVQGLLSPVGPAKAFGGSVAVMDIDGARVSLGKEGKVDRIDLVLEEQTDREKIRQKLERILGEGFQVVTPEAQSEQLHQLVAAFQGMLGFMSALALVIGIFLVFNSVTVAVAERRREIGTLRALGATRGEVLWMILLENAVLGAVAGALGAFLGHLIAVLLSSRVIGAMAAQSAMRIQLGQLQFGLKEIMGSIFLGLAVSSLSALKPALRAMSIPPTEALRPKGAGSSASLEINQKKGNRKYSALSAIFGVFLLSGVLIFKLPQVRPLFSSSRIGEMLNLLQPILGILGAILVTGPVVNFSIAVLIKVFSHSNSWSSRLALENLKRNPSRTLSNVMSTLIGLMLVVIIGAVHVSFRQTITSWLDKVMAVGDMALSSNGKMVMLQVQPLREEILDQIRKTPGVSTSEDHPIFVLRYLKLEFEGKTLAIKALDPVSERSGFRFIDGVDGNSIEEGHRLFTEDEPTILVSENFVRNFGRKTGDLIELNTPSGRVRFKIVGVMRDLANPNGVFYLNRNWIKRFWNDHLVTVFFVTAAPQQNREEVFHRLNSTFGSQGIITTLNRELVKDLMETVDQSFSFNAAIELAALLVGLIALINTMLVSILERTREFGMLRAVGMERKQLAKMILWESVAQGTLGALAAIVLGSYLSWLWVTVNLSTALGWLIQYVFPLRSILEVFALGVIVATLAGVLPALRAMKVELRTALENE